MRSGTLQVLCAVCLPQLAAAAGGVSIFKLGTQIDQKRWDILWMYFVTFGLTMILETVVHQVHVVVKSNTGQQIVHHIVQEVMILGAISAGLVVFENLGGSALIDAPLFHYVHFVIFLMMVIFICLVTMLFSSVQPSWMNWERFEERVCEIENDPAMQNEERVAFLTAFVKTMPEGNRMLACLCFFRQNLPSRFIDISFSRYMKKIERKILLSFLHLTPRSWLLLALLCALAGVTVHITTSISDNPVATIALWVLLVGFGPLVVLVVLVAKVRREFTNFAVSVQEMRQCGLTRPARHQSEYFWRGYPGFSVALVQTLLLWQVFYLATVWTNFTTRLWSYGKEQYGGPSGLLLILGCVAPSAVVFFVMIPLILPWFTILSAQGDFLDHECLLRMVQQDQMSGKFRRRRYRDRQILTLGEALSLDSNTLMLRFRSQFGGGGRKAAAGASEADSDEDETSGKAVLCSEVSLVEGVETPCQQLATVRCEQCGFLCGDHDTEYHRLRLCKDHDRAVLDGDAADDRSLGFSGSFAAPLPHRTGLSAEQPAEDWVPPWQREAASPAVLKGEPQAAAWTPLALPAPPPGGAPPPARAAQPDAARVPLGGRGCGGAGTLRRASSGPRGPPRAAALPGRPPDPQGVAAAPSAPGRPPLRRLSSSAAPGTRLEQRRPPPLQSERSSTDSEWLTQRLAPAAAPAPARVPAAPPRGGPPPRGGAAEPLPRSDTQQTAEGPRRTRLMAPAATASGAFMAGMGRRH
eukprot:TRINITY_DN4573_c2_g2_i1.p1 TRINITY_DN4573_c2_g2~~TRINITY_DN4573_c2_g2_i1.p1  ORF type:complete len:751 (+),score=236.75 TRINITY_DN4573_c2_g2_i1:114-2366(+)